MVMNIGPRTYTEKYDMNRGPLRPELDIGPATPIMWLAIPPKL